MIEKKLKGVQIAQGETFRFACRPGLSCFNTCCRDKRLPLYPYDVLRLRRALGRPSQKILADFAELEFDPVSGWPALRLRLDDRGRCPFVGGEGCAVYAHRPAACRIYPLTRAAKPGVAGSGPLVVHLRLETTGCLGWQEKTVRTLASWEEEQGLTEYHRANDRLMELLLHPRRTGRLKLNQAQTHAVIAALYNLDVFRQNIALKGFGEKFGFSDADIAGAGASDEDLLVLGEKWLCKVLFANDI